MALRPNAGYGLFILVVSRSHTTTHHSRCDSSWRVISSSQKPLPDNTQHPQQTNIHAQGGIRTHDLSRRAAVDLLLSPRDHWDLQCSLVCERNIACQEKNSNKHKPDYIIWTKNNKYTSVFNPTSEFLFFPWDLRLWQRGIWGLRWMSKR